AGQASWTGQAGAAGWAGGAGQDGREGGLSAAARLRAAALIWGGSLLVTGGVFSYMAGIFHPYYTVALAPAIGALVGPAAYTLATATSAHTGAIPSAGPSTTAFGGGPGGGFGNFPAPGGNT